MLRVTLVSYLNTKPFVEGLYREFFPEEMEIDERSPSGCASALMKGECDLALIPVAALDEIKGIEVLSSFCIGSEGNVDSVFLFSQVPVEEIEKVILDPDSRTSNLLVQILFQKHWKKQAEFIPGEDRDFIKTSGKTARVAIGDDAHKLKGKFKYTYDLSGEWNKLTGLPFVFAVWAAKKGKIKPETEAKLNEAFETGMEMLEDVAEMYFEEFGYTKQEAFEYLSNSLSFRLDTEKWDALEQFQEYAEELEELVQVDLQGKTN